MPSKMNHEQSAQIAKLETKVDNIDTKLGDFITNEFAHFKSVMESKFNWIVGLVVLGILIPIVLFIIK